MRVDGYHVNTLSNSVLESYSVTCEFRLEPLLWEFRLEPLLWEFRLEPLLWEFRLKNLVGVKLHCQGILWEFRL